MKPRYAKKLLNEKDLDAMRIALSVLDLKLGPEPCCDFCGYTPPMYVFSSSRMSTGEYRRCWRWCACLSCSRYIDAGQFEPIKDKIMEWAASRIPGMSEKSLRNAAEISFNEFIAYAELET